MTHPQNFVEHLQRLAISQADDTALVVVGERGGQPFEQSFSYAQFEQRVRALAALLQSCFGAGDRLLVMLDNDEHYAVAMFACFYAGVIAVPVFPPESTRPQHIARLAGIAADAQAGGILTAASLQSVVAAAARKFGVASVIAVDEVDIATAQAWTRHAPTPADIAFLQYTSGSTSAPKGVMVSHGNLIANERAIQEGQGIGADDKVATWSPLFHDMGLIGGLLQPFYSGIPCVLMAPRFFLERPVRWLETISRHRITVSGGPDFAYRLCLDRVKEAQWQALDLSSWRVAYTGAEPVRHDTMEEFIARYAPAGFRADAVYACYGLAEATLFVTGGQRGAGMVVNRFCSEQLAQGRAAPIAQGRALVGCGSVPSAHELRIVDPGTGAGLEPGRIGEVWAGGPSIAQGYWGKPGESAETFVERDGRRWLRTGDLGFVHDGQLHVAGRIKDMIIVRGHNIYPQDMERAVESEVEAVRKGRVAAFAVALDGTEGIGVAAEVSRGMQKLVTPQALVDAIAAAVSEQCGEAPQAVALLDSGALPRTSSGKLQRAACRRGWVDRSLDAYALYEHGRFVAGPGGVAAAAQPVHDEMQQALAALWREVLKHDAGRHYAAETSFFGCGGNSLSAVQLAARIGRHWCIDFPVRQVFEQPRLGELARAVQRMLAAGRCEPAQVIPVLSPERRAEPLPLSHGQERMWLLWRVNPASTAYHVSVGLRLKGAVQPNALREALDVLIERHESLRTVFQQAADGSPTQCIRPAFPLPLHMVDLADVPADTREARAMAEAQRLQQEPFDLARGPLLRAALIRLAADTHVLVMVIHHIVCDGASMQLLVDQLAAAYAAQVQGVPADWAPPPIQVADHAIWQRAWLAEGSAAGQLAWWRSQLGEEHPVLSLPSDRPRKPQASYRAARHGFELPADLLTGLRDLSQARGATLFMALLAGFQALLHRYTGQQDIRVGVPVAHRERPETAGVVGFFVNTLVLRNVVDGRRSLAQVLDQTRSAMLEAQAHQDLPFEQLVQAMQPGRSLGHNPLFQVAFNHLPQDEAALHAMPGLAVQPWLLEESDAQFELTLDTREHADGRVTAVLLYARELFEPQTIERLALHYLKLLQTLAAQPQQPLGQVDLLTRDEALLAFAAPAAQPVAEGVCVHHLFEACAARRPEGIALTCGDERISYAELNARANRLAHWLLRQGVGPETKVGVALKRSPAMVVALLAILKAGGAYVPIDPGYPAQRLAYLLADSGISVLLTDAESGGSVPNDAALPRFDIDTLDFSALPGHNPAVRLHPANLAYVIYTSGSTGKPKGTQVCHHNVVRLLDATKDWFRFDHRDVWTLFHSYAFDFSVWEIFGALCHGGQLVIVPHEVSRAPDAFLALLRRHGVTVLNQTPSAFRQLLQLPALHQEQQEQTSLRLVIFGGEALEPQTLRPWVERFGDAGPRLVNMYGITETTVHVTYRPIMQGDVLQGGSSPIGRQIPDLGLHVLDADMNPVPLCVAGELYVSGAGLARGYLHRAGLSAERFVADPFDRQGGRLYRSGDRVRRRADGELEYLGRVDQQVKVRGHRIELGEVQAQLLGHPGVREVLVLARPDSSGTQLVAYVAADPSHGLAPQTLREALRTTLPDYMVPTSIVMLETFPLTANGKIDRNALPPPQSPAGSAHAAPAGGAEQVIAQVWCELLGTPRVGRHDNFFEIGGHSLLLMKVHRLLEERLNAGLGVVDLFRYPTVEALAAFIESTSASDASQRTAERAKRQRAAFLGKKSLERVTP